MSTLAIDTRKLLKALKGTGKSANFTAEEIADAVDVAQEDAELLTRSEFRLQMDAFKAQMDAFKAQMDAFKAQMDAFKAQLDGFNVQLDGFKVQLNALGARIDAMEARFDAKLEALRADIKADVKASQVQNLMWLSGIVLASNGMVIALLARLAHVV
jgi:predicted  nucleic acid-binding Zn-ribbon protein